MSKPFRYQKLYMDIAGRVSDMSHARRLQVGAVIVKDDRIISMGFNGMPSGWDNNCEDTVVEEHDEKFVTVLRTKPEVLHAESNALAKLARSTESGDGADIFITHAPCLDCAKMIYQTGIRRVFYRNSYRSDDGLQFLKQSGVDVKNIASDDNS
jgi:dCMP deaminase